MLVLQSQRVLTPEGLRPAAIAIEDERIAAVYALEGLPEGITQRAVVVDCGDDVLMAGLIDTHVHINEPGRSEWEGFETATRAAAHGGVTTLCDMPLNCIPVTTRPAALDDKLEASAHKLHVDVAYWGGVVPGNARDVRALIEAGAPGAKCFLCHSGIDDFPKVGAAELRPAMKALVSAGAPLLVHAELESPVDLPDLPDRDYRRYLASRPRSWEDAAVAMMIALCRETGCAVHIVHLSSASALPLLAEARDDGLPITVETCPHYLCLAAEEVPMGDTSYKCAPPIREASNRDGLWAGLRDGIIDLVVTDHSPCVPALKLPEEGDFMQAWGGIASLGLGLPAVWSEAQRRGHGLEDLARWMSATPARLIGVGDRKGKLAAGFDADIVRWRPEARFVVEEAALHQRHKVTPYRGRELTGCVVSTWLRGAAIAGDGAAETSRGQPVLVKRS